MYNYQLAQTGYCRKKKICLRELFKTSKSNSELMWIRLILRNRKKFIPSKKIQKKNKN